jgi:hypothetical protein
MSPSVDDEIDEEHTDTESFFFVINIEKDQSVKFCHLSFDQDYFLYGEDGKCGMYLDSWMDKIGGRPTRSLEQAFLNA